MNVVFPYDDQAYIKKQSRWTNAGIQIFRVKVHVQSNFFFLTGEG